MSTSVLWALFGVNAIAVAGLLAVAVRGVRRLRAMDGPGGVTAAAGGEGAGSMTVDLRVVEPAVVDLRDEEQAREAPTPEGREGEPSASSRTHPGASFPSPRAALDEERWASGSTF